MTQSIRVQCIQMHSYDSVVGTGEFESGDMGMEPWRQAIHAAAIASGFHSDLVREFVLDWASDLEAKA